MKEKQRKPIIGFHADIPFDKRHGMHFEATYNKNKIDIYDKKRKKLNGKISKTATVYADYTTPNRSANPHASVTVSVWGTEHPLGEKHGGYVYLFKR